VLKLSCFHISPCFSRQFMNFLWKRSQIPLPPGADHGCEMHAAGLLGQRFFLKKFKLADEDSHSTDSSVSGEEGNSDPQNCTKMLRNLTFVVQFEYFYIRPNKGRQQQKFFLFF